MIAPISFVKEAWYELRKSTWLSRQQAFDSTRAVMVLVVIVALYVSAVDFVLNIILKAILG